MYRVLVVDDEPRVLRALSQAMLEYDVAVSTSARDAREMLLNSEPFDAIIADQMMPEEKGHELLSWCRKHQPECERFLLTGLPITADLRETLTPAGKVKIFSKPWNPESLSLELDRVIAKKESLVVDDLSITEKPALADVPEHASQYKIENRLFVFDSSGLFSRHHSEDLSTHYDELVKLDRDTLSDKYSGRNAIDNTEIVFELGNQIAEDVDLIKHLMNFYHAKHVLILAQPGDALKLNAFKMDSSRFSVITIPFSPKRLLHNLKFIKSMQ